ncbi:MAG: AmmeMemoRadiSam system radical SAM enzyme [Armatimonadota bacterium]
MRRTTWTRRGFLSSAARGGAALGMCPRLLLGPLSQAGQAVYAASSNVSDQPARYWRPLSGTDLQCALCPRLCKVKNRERGFCGARENVNGAYKTRVYGRPCADAVLLDPIEKAPFYHVTPAAKTLAMGTAGCNLDCKYCQSWEWAQNRPEATTNKVLPPARVVAACKKYGVKCIVFTFTEPVQCIEYVIDTAREAKKSGIRTTVHTAAYIQPGPLKDMLTDVAAVNVDLKGFSEDFYKTVTGASLSPVLATIKAIKEAGKWLEITNLVVPGYNDSEAMVRKMARWVIENCGPETPLHMSRFFPQYKLLNVPATPTEKLRALRQVAWKEGVKFPYIGNVPGEGGENTFCPRCGTKLIRRVGYAQTTNLCLDARAGRCGNCGNRIPGLWS